MVPIWGPSIISSIRTAQVISEVEKSTGMELVLRDIDNPIFVSYNGSVSLHLEPRDGDEGWNREWAKNPPSGIWYKETTDSTHRHLLDVYVDDYDPFWSMLIHMDREPFNITILARFVSGVLLLVFAGIALSTARPYSVKHIEAKRPDVLVRSSVLKDYIVPSAIDEQKLWDAALMEREAKEHDDYADRIDRASVRASVTKTQLKEAETERERAQKLRDSAAALLSGEG